MSRQGAAALRERRFQDASRIYRDLAILDAGNPMWHLNLALALHGSGEYRGALLEAGVFLKDRPAPGPGHFVSGLAYLKLNQPCDAIAPLEKARQWQATRQILTELADAQQGCGHWEAAAREYESAAKAGASEPKLWRQSAHGWWTARRYDKAKAAFLATGNAFENDGEFQYEFGDTLVRLEGAKSGLARLERAVTLLPGLIAARGALGRALLEAGRAAEAVPHLEAAGIQDPAALLPLSRAYRSVGRTEDAAQAEADYKKRMAAPQN
jgi:tetratricopeptide (TPR) repeat protein